MADDPTFRLAEIPVHLGLGATAVPQEIGGTTRSVTLQRGEAVVNPPGVWHTADVSEPATALFITAGLGTEIRPR